MLSVSLVLSALALFAQATPVAQNLQLHESRSGVPSGFVLSGPADDSTVLNLRLALVESDSAGLINALYDVSTPSSANYRNHLSKEDVEKFVAPAQESVDAVNTWLSANGLSAQSISPAGDWLSISVPVSDASALFGTNFSVFTHQDTGKQLVRTMQYSIPAALQGHLDFVHPTITFDNLNGNKPAISAPVSVSGSSNVTAEASSSCASVVTPSCLQSLYGIPTTPATQSSNQIGVSGFIDQFANQNDLKTFLKQLRPDMSSSTTFTLQTLDDGSNSQTGSQAGIEADLDVQYTVGVATDVPVVFISVGEDNNDGNLGGFLDIINFLLGEDAPPQVLTTSYGQDEDTISRSLANKLCNAYAQLGSRGTSILFASGDGGVSGSQSQSCSTFIPTFPSGCPFLTSVGATTGISPEKAATFSAGGFSNYFGQPSFQSSAVPAYLSALGSTDKGKFNTSGRGYPDVSAQGQNVEIVVDGQSQTVDGTSCASPIFASVIGLLNDELAAAGQPSLGFLNPWLYSTASSALNDITSGDNPGCNTNGFPAKSGWDPVTGLGTPNFAALRTAAGL